MTEFLKLLQASGSDGVAAVAVIVPKLALDGSGENHKWGGALKTTGPLFFDFLLANGTVKQIGEFLLAKVPYRPAFQMARREYTRWTCQDADMRFKALDELGRRGGKEVLQILSRLESEVIGIGDVFSLESSLKHGELNRISQLRENLAAPAVLTPTTQPKKQESVPTKEVKHCIICGAPATQVRLCHKWSFPFCSTEQCAETGRELIERHAMDLLFSDNVFARSTLPQTPQMQRILAIVDKCEPTA